MGEDMQVGEGTRQPRMVLYVDASMYEEGKGFRPVFVKEGESGFYPQGNPEKFQEPWYFGHDFEAAQERCAEYNARLGISRDEATKIVFDSMFGH